LRNLFAQFIFLIAVAAVACDAWGVPAAPFVHKLRQPTGETFSARQWGDEFQSGWETESGYTIHSDQEQSFWTYAGLDHKGELTGSRHRVARDEPPAASKRLRPTKRHGLSRRAIPFAGSPAPLLSPAGKTTAAGPLLDNTPVITRNIPVILVNFSDTSVTYSAADFATLLFASGNWSFKDFYEEVSGGAFTVTPGPAGVQGWFTASATHDYYGQKSGWGPPDKWPGDLVYEAVSQADAAVDFSAYDFDGDCVVDVVAIIHQGPAQEASSVTTDIWSQSWSLSSTYGYGMSHYPPYVTNDVCPGDPGRFMTVDDYIMMPETLPASLDPGIATIGVFAHEFGHALGLIDLYDSDRTSEGIGNWSSMASGSWGKVLRAGDRPTHLDPWSKRALGWLEPVRILADDTGRSLPSVVGSGQVWQFRDGSPAAGGEYFLAENRQLTGFDAALPGAGLLLWHIDEARSGNTYEWYEGCTSCTSHYKVALVQADNLFDLERETDRGDGGDPFPGVSANRSISHLTSPYSRLYSGLPAGFALSSISDSGTDMTADILLADGVPPVTTINSGPPGFANSAGATFSFSADETATFDCRTDGGSYFPCSSPHTVTGLVDGGHSFTVRGTDATGAVEVTPPAYNWTVDTIAPDTNLQTNLATITAAQNGSFTFAAGESVTVFSCSLDNAPWTECTTPHEVAGLADGAHSFAVRASDQAGNTDPTPETFSWTVARNIMFSISGQQDSFYVTLGAALAAVVPGPTALLKARDIDLSEELVIDNCGVVTLQGGYSPGFSVSTGQTGIAGSITVVCGTIILDGISVK